MNEFSHVVIREICPNTDDAEVELESAPSPVPECEMIDWLKVAAKLPGRASVVTAIMIWDLAVRLDRRQCIMVTPTKLSTVGLGRVTTYRALIDLENAGLITVTRKQGRSPLVCILPHPRSES